MEIKSNTYHFTLSEKKKIKKLIDKKYGKISTPIDYETTSGDFDIGLEEDIFKYTRERISGSTLERLVGLTGKEKTGSREITVEIVSKYLGFHNLKQFCKQIEYSISHPEPSSGNLNFKSVFKQHLINIQFGIDKAITTRYLNTNRLEILSSINNKFLKGDSIELSTLEIDEELICTSVSRFVKNEIIQLGSYKSGDNNKITSISLSK